MNERSLTKEIYMSEVSEVSRSRPRKMFEDQIGDILKKAEIHSDHNPRVCMQRVMDVKEAKVVYHDHICSGLLLQKMIPKTMAYRKDGASKYNEYLVEDQQTTKQNYLVQRDMDHDLLGESFDIVYPNMPLQYERKPDQLPALIVDYANMIRNDIILLDNSVETRTRKRGNIKVKKYNVPFESPCECEVGRPRRFNLGNKYYPDVMEYANCDNNLCSHPYKCQGILYNQTMLIRKSSESDNNWILPDDLTAYLIENKIMKRDSIGLDASFVYVHGDLGRRWKAVTIPVVVSCICKRDYTITNNK